MFYNLQVGYVGGAMIVCDTEGDGDCVYLVIDHTYLKQACRRSKRSVAK